MRTRQLLLVAASTAVLVGAGGGAVASGAEDGHHYLTGTQTFLKDIEPGMYAELEGMDEIRGASAAYDLRMSDPRVSGTLTTRDVSMDAYTGSRLAFDGAVELVTDAGTWTGTTAGVFEPTMGWQILSTLEGWGDLEGLTFYLHGASPEMADGVWEMDGFIVGELPAE
jgi:hypothetical protein